jgi:hypothetical protein
MTPAQCRAARALLGWKQIDLGRKAGMTSQMPVFYYERHGYKKDDKGSWPGARYVSDDAIAQIKRALEKEGVEFIDDTGVNLRRIAGG